jgi:L-iditol 2-dehydrogenase
MSFMAIPGERNGVFSEYCAHPASMCYKLPSNMDTLEGALIEPLSVGFHAVMQSGAKPGQTAIVLGCGCIGLVTIMVLKACGVATIYACDVLDKRLDKAKEVGASAIIRSDKEDVAAFCKSLPFGGVDLVFETAGNKITTLMTAKLVRKAGSVTLVGMAPTPELTYDIGSLMDKEAKLNTVFRYRNLYPTAIAAVSGGLIPLKSIVSHEFAFKDLIEGVAYNVDNKQDVIKAVIKF